MRLCRAPEIAHMPAELTVHSCSHALGQRGRMVMCSGEQPAHLLEISFSNRHVVTRESAVRIALHDPLLLISWPCVEWRAQLLRGRRGSSSIAWGYSLTSREIAPLVNQAARRTRV